MSLSNTAKNSPVPVIYARKSVGQSDAESCEAQIEQCQAYLKRIGIDPSTFVVITDKAMSSSDRPGYARVQELWKAKRLATLVVFSLDRLGRTDGVINVIRDIIFAGTQVIVVDIALSTDRPGWEDLVRMASMSDRSTSQRLGQRVCLVQRRMALSGRVPTKPIAGYTVVTDGGRKKLVIDEAGAVVIRGMFERVARSKTGDGDIGAVTRWINGLSLDVRKTLGIRGKATAAAVRCILTNSKYAGVWTWGRTVTVRSTDGRRRSLRANPGEVIRIERPALAIVTKALFARVQAVLAGCSKRAA